MIAVGDLFREAQRFSDLLDKGIGELGEWGRTYATAEAAYRKAKAQAWTRAPRDMLAAERAAWVDAETADLRAERDLAESMRQTVLEAVRSRRAQLSALQTFAAAHRAEAELAKYGGVAV